MGNICRSPTAEGVFRNLVRERGLDAKIEIDSAGTHAYHSGEAPDRRAQATAKARGVDLGRIRARPVELLDFDRFDYIVAMDHENLAYLSRGCPTAAKNRLHLLCSFAPDLDTDVVPDPYYGGPDGFDYVFDVVWRASKGLLDAIERDRLRPDEPTLC
jgi:protein-tyrosine phosphatase